MVQSDINSSVNDKFSVSLLAFWVKGTLKVDNRFLHVDLPNTVLFGLIPAGRNRQNVPLTGITNVATSNSYKMGAMIFGAIIAIAGVASLSSSGIGALIITLIGILMFLSGIKTSLTFEKSGTTETIDVPFFEGSKIREFADDINNHIAQRQDDTNVRMQTDRQINSNQQSSQAIVDAINNQNNNTAVSQAPSNVTPISQNNGGVTNFCPSCGAKVEDGAKFCTHCGNKIA